MEPTATTVLLLLLLSITSGFAENMLHCTGRLSKFTYSDCQGDDWNGPGCFYLEHFAQYRPCSQICNGMEIGSIDVTRCEDYCPKYFAKYCISKAKENIPATATTETKIGQRVSVPKAVKPQKVVAVKPSEKTLVKSSEDEIAIPSTLLICVVIGVAALFVCLVIVAVVCVKTRPRRPTMTNTFKKHGRYMTPTAPQTCTEDNKSYILPTTDEAGKGKYYDRTTSCDSDKPLISGSYAGSNLDVSLKTVDEIAQEKLTVATGYTVPHAHLDIDEEKQNAVNQCLV